MIPNLTIYLNTNKTQKPGTLAQKNKKIYFEYDKDFLKTKLEISPYKLPLKSGLFRCDDKTFDGIWGVLSYESSREIKTDLQEILLDDLAKSSKEILEGSSELLVEELLSLNGSSAGARPKVLVQISEDLTKIVHGKSKLKDGFSHWMVKFASSMDSFEIGAIEYAYSPMAKDAGLIMPDSTLIKTRKVFCYKKI